MKTSKPKYTTKVYKATKPKKGTIIFTQKPPYRRSKGTKFA